MRGSIITALAEGTEGVVWIGTRSGLAILDNESISKIEESELSAVNVTALFFDYRERLWVGTATKGIFVLDENGTMNFSQQQGLQSNFIRAVFVDSQDNIWVGTDQGVSLIRSNGTIEQMDQVAGAPFGFTNRFLEDTDGSIWLGSNDGLRRFNQSFELVDHELELGHHVVQSLYQDEEKNIWAGTYRAGLQTLNQSKFLLLGEDEGLSNEIINVTYSDGMIFWAGSDGGLICLKEGVMETFELGRRSAGNRIRDIFRDSQGRLWLCTYHGLVQFDKGKVVQRYTVRDGLCSNNTRRIVEDAEGSLWIGTANGLNRFKDGKFDKYGAESGLSDKFIMSLFMDRAHTLWVGTNGGGTFKFQNDRFQAALLPDGANDIVFNMFQDGNDAIWISTNRGVLFINDSLRFNITPSHGLLSNNIFQVIVDDLGQVWFTSDHGVMRTSMSEIINLVTGKADKLYDIRIFDMSDGLRTGNITAASISGHTNEGEIWFCTIKGVAILDSENISTNEIRPNTLMTLVIADNKEYPTGEGAVLPAGNRRLEFHYTGFSYYAPEKIQYKYKLENFDQNWVDAGTRRTAYYTNIPPGEYEFKVMAANNDGLWSETSASINLIQNAYFYQTTWFYFIAGVFLVAFGAFLYYLRARKLKLRNFQLAKMVQERTRDIQYQNQAIVVQKEELKQLNTVKNKLLSVISHDLRGPIAAVSGLLGLLKSGHLNYQELITQSDRLNNEVHSLTYLLDNLLSWSKSQMQGIKLKKENVGLKKVVEENLKTTLPMSASKQINVDNQVPEDCYVQTDANFLGLVIRNLVINAIKFTHEKGEICIVSESQDDNVLISVNDNGVGLTKEDLKKLFDKKSHYSKMGTANEAGTGIGLLLCKEFIDLEGGKIWAESEEGKGSSFKFVLKQGSPQIANTNRS
jgi:ligand-binding sensor domain-containing protein/signal transduction histidine kinase